MLLEICVASVIVWAIYERQRVLAWIRRYRRPVSLPVVNLDGFKFSQATERYKNNARFWVQKGYETGEPFLMWTSTGYQLILSTDFLFELQLLQNDTLPIALTMQETIVDVPFEYGTETTDPHIAMNIMHRQMNVHLTDILPRIYEETLRALLDCLPKTKEWTAFSPWDGMDKVANAVMQFIWFGEDLAKDPDWRAYSVDGEHDFYSLAREVGDWPFLLKPLAALLSKRGNAFRKTMSGAHERLATEFRKREKESQSDRTMDHRQDWLQWALRCSTVNRKLRTPPEKLSEITMFLFFDAVFALRVQLSMQLFDLAAYPEYVPPLREEIRSKLGDEDHGFEDLSEKRLDSLWKLDSWVKESLRLNPPAYITSERSVKKPIVLSNGLSLPPRTKLGFSNAARAIDPKYWGATATKFDGFRFEKMRLSGSAQEQKDYAYVNSTLDDPLFGKGIQMCPARFLMNATVKSALVAFLNTWDVKLEGKIRPENGADGTMLMPPTDSLLIRLRQEI